MENGLTALIIDFTVDERDQLQQRLEDSGEYHLVLQTRTFEGARELVADSFEPIDVVLISEKFDQLETSFLMEDIRHLANGSHTLFVCLRTAESTAPLAVTDLKGIGYHAFLRDPVSESDLDELNDSLILKRAELIELRDQAVITSMLNEVVKRLDSLSRVVKIGGAREEELEQFRTACKALKGEVAKRSREETYIVLASSIFGKAEVPWFSTDIKYYRGACKRLRRKAELERGAH